MNLFVEKMRISYYFPTDPFPQSDKFTYCAYRDNSAGDGSEQGLGQVMPDGKTSKCSPNNYCFSYWQLDPKNKSRIVIVYQGKILSGAANIERPWS